MVVFLEILPSRSFKKIFFLFNQVPFINYQYNTFGRLLNITGDMHILGSKWLCGINNKQDKVANVSYRADYNGGGAMLWCLVLLFVPIAARRIRQNGIFPTVGGVKM